MSQLVVANNLSAQTNASVSTSATTIALVAGMGARFPAITGGNWMYLAAWVPAGAFEIFKLTAVAGDNLTVVRGQDGTTGTAWGAGTTLFAITLNAQAVADLRTQLAAAAITGVTMTGPLALLSNPTSALHAVTKQYADALYWSASTSYQTKYPHTPAEMTTAGTAAVTLNWNTPTLGVLNLLVNGLNVAYAWTSSKLNPALKAPKGNTAFATSIYEWAELTIGNIAGGLQPQLVEPGSPWLLEGIRWVTANPGAMYNRIMYLKNG